LPNEKKVALGFRVEPRSTSSQGNQKSSGTRTGTILDGFESKLTSSRYAKLTKCSQDTAYRDILTLVERGVLVQNPEDGRSTSYSLAPLQ